MQNVAISPEEIDRRARQALVVWGVFIVLLVIANDTIPFVLGVDLHAWTYSKLKSVVFDFVFCPDICRCGDCRCNLPVATKRGSYLVE